jgi:hypothetical protein
MLYYTPVLPQPQLYSAPQPFSFDSSSLFGVQLGKDTTNTFALSVHGLAVLTPSGRYVAKRRKRNALVDVSLLALPGVDPLVFRLPVKRVKPGDLIMVSESPLSVLYVLETYSDRPREIRGLDPYTGEAVDYSLTENLFNLNFFVQVTSLFDLLSGENEDRD